MKPIKINRPGLKLRNKSSIHANIIDEITGRRKIDACKTVMDKIKVHEIKENYFKSDKSNNLRDLFASEDWPINGSKVLETRPFLKDNELLLKKFPNKHKLNICVLGPGMGAEVIYINTLFSKFKNKNIDTLGLTNYLSPEAKSIVKKDYSPSKLSESSLFEHMNHLHLTNKYDYIYSNVGPGYHTNHPEIVILKVASMLRPGGYARIEVKDTNIIENINKYLSMKKLENNIKLSGELWKDAYSHTFFILIERLK